MILFTQTNNSLVYSHTESPVLLSIKDKKGKFVLHCCDDSKPITGLGQGIYEVYAEFSNGDFYIQDLTIF